MSRTHSPKGTRVSIAAPHAKEVHVAGTFNRWNPRKHPLDRGRAGQWVGFLDLPPGPHEYKFIVDGRWCCAGGRDEPYDGRAGHARNEFGTMNIVMLVPATRRRGREGPHGYGQPGPMRAPLQDELELARYGAA